MKVDHSNNGNLSLHFPERSETIVAVGEVLWDLYDGSRHLGGAPLNFATHAHRLGHPVALLSAVGDDELGAQALELMVALGINGSLLQTSSRLATGTARVSMNLGQAQFAIERPAAYDDVHLQVAEVARLETLNPGWLYFGTLFASSPCGLGVLQQLFQALPGAVKFYDLNLRPGAGAPDLVAQLLAQAHVVKLNEQELDQIHGHVGLPGDLRQFCEAGVARFGWKAVAITLGSRGCAIWSEGHYVEAPGIAIEVVDTVGAGDAFAAAFVHGLSRGWPVSRIAPFANRLGALVSSSRGAIPEWSMDDPALREWNCARSQVSS